MKILVLSGSPHKNGSSICMAQTFCAALGGDVSYFYAYDNTVAPCIDCGRCAQESGCSLDDGGAALLHAIDEADVIVLASPVYFSDLTGPMISAASRLQYLWMRRRGGETVLSPKPRRGVILLAGGGSGKPDRALANARCYLHQLGVQICAEICSLDTDRTPVRDDHAAMAAIRGAAEEMRRETPFEKGVSRTLPENLYGN